MRQSLEAKQYLEVEQAGGVVRVLREGSGRSAYMDLRRWWLERESGEIKPTGKGISLNIGRLPQLRAALELAELEALQDGLLEVADYELAGLELPAGLVS
jgi:hypothetical protein